MPDICDGQCMEVATSASPNAGGETLSQMINMVCAWGPEQVDASGSNSTAVWGSISLDPYVPARGSISL